MFIEVLTLGGFFLFIFFALIFERGLRGDCCTFYHNMIEYPKHQSMSMTLTLNTVQQGDVVTCMPLWALYTSIDSSLGGDHKQARGPATRFVSRLGHETN